MCRHNSLEPRSRTQLPPPRAHPAQAAAADMRLRKRRRGLPRSADREENAPRSSPGVPHRNFEFQISNLPPPSLHPPPETHSRRAAVAEGLVARDPTVLATRGASSTVDAPQSASKAIYHSYLSESRGGLGPTWLSEGGWAGGGGGKNRVRRRPPARIYCGVYGNNSFVH